MKNKYLIIFLLILIILGIGIFVWFSFTNNNSSDKKDYTTEKTQANVKENVVTNKNTISNSTDKNENSSAKTKEKEEKKPKETEISTFSTPIVSPDPARQNNVSITCSTLNDIVVNNGDTFSFCDTVGQATTEKGYQKAEIFDAQRK